jgi:hypothetical protein
MNKTPQEIIDKIKELRLNNYSLNKICKETNLPKATVSKYIQGIKCNIVPDIESIMKNRQAATNTFKLKMENERELIVNNAIKEWKNVKNDKDLMILLIGFWGEGAKRTKFHRIAFKICNSDPVFIKIIINILIKLKYDYKSLIYIYEGDKKEIKDIWLKMIPNLNIKKVYLRPKRSKLQAFSKIGTCHIESSSELWLKVMTWMKCWAKDLNINDNYQN